MKRSKSVIFAAAAVVMASAWAVPAVAQSDNAAAANAELAAPQVDKIRDYFKRTKPAIDPIEVSRMNVSVGTTVPADIATEPLPGAILVDLPPGVDYRYFLLGTDLVIVNAETRTVVGIVRKPA